MIAACSMFVLAGCNSAKQTDCCCCAEEKEMNIQLYSARDLIGSAEDYAANHERVLKALADMAGVKYEAVYRVTSVDPPELVRVIKNEHPDVTREVPRDRDGNPITMWNLILKRLMPPTRIVRYCCSSLKETGGDGRMTLTGVRWAESSNRKQNQGLVTIVDKTVSQRFEDNPNFQQTNRGGWC